MIRKYGSESFEVEPEQIAWIQENPNCVGIYYVNTQAGEDYYVWAEKSGRSNGAITVRQVKRKDEKEFYYIHLHYNYNLKNFDGVQLHRLHGDAAHENIMIRYLPVDYIWKNPI